MQEEFPRSEKLGTAPGSLIFVGSQKEEKYSLKLLNFDADHLESLETLHIKDLDEAYKNSSDTLWLQCTALHDIQTIQKIGDVFNLHNLMLEDVLNTRQRPKTENFDEHLFFVLKQLHYEADTKTIKSEQVSIVFGDSFLILFLESKNPIFQAIEQRLKKAKSKIRSRKSDYLAFALIDLLVDHYINVIEYISEEIEQLEDEMLNEAKPEHMDRIYALKKDVNFLRKTVRPARELITQFSKYDSELIDPINAPFIKDLEDHAIHAVESIEAHKDTLNELFNSYNTIQNNKLNDTLRVLTVFSVVFIPLTFLAGIYGTNFEFIPELKYKYAYPIFWAVMLLTAAGMIYYFKRKKWF